MINSLWFERRKSRCRRLIPGIWHPSNQASMETHRPSSVVGVAHASTNELRIALREAVQCNEPHGTNSRCGPLAADGPGTSWLSAVHVVRVAGGKSDRKVQQESLDDVASLRASPGVVSRLSGRDGRGPLAFRGQSAACRRGSWHRAEHASFPVSLWTFRRRACEARRPFRRSRRDGGSGRNIGDDGRTCRRGSALNAGCGLA